MSALTDVTEIKTVYPLLGLFAPATGSTGATGPAGATGSLGTASSVTGSKFWSQIYMQRFNTGTDGGDLTLNTWTNRPMNTTGGGNLHNRFSMLSNDRIILAPGNYFMEASAVGFRQGVAKIRFRDTTNNVTLVNGINTQSGVSTTVTTAASVRIAGGFTLDTMATVELQQISAAGTNQMGRAASFSGAEDEVYAIVKISRR